MKNYNLKQKLTQKGGLMIEALAMLGLIAVVTPTMYKKSAERTLEVEDINTASTVRSFMSAAESYVAANYIALMDPTTPDHFGIADGGAKIINNADLAPYLPYQFSTDNSLYNYNAPTIAVARNGNNLTAFALFPAKGAGDLGIGQERTARIASLVGSTGGYVTGEKTARGVGGIWNLDSTQYEHLFGSDNSPVYSLVAASSSVINGSSAAAMVENTKYLQRTAENGENEKWRNSMRTDIYMGGHNNTDPDDKSAGLHSIRNIESLIVGTETDDTNKNNGLYITGGSNPNPNAYIYGTLRAVAENLFADTHKFRYGKVDDDNYRFEVDVDGNVTNYGNVDMGTDLTDNGYVYLGLIDNNDNYMFKGEINGSGADLSLLNDNMIKMTSDDNTDLRTDNAYGTKILIADGKFKGAGQTADLNSIGGNIVPAYNDAGIKPKEFPVVVGSNMMVEGLLSAGQVDAQHLRTASFSSGSEHINDANKWLEVDANGVKIANTDGVGTEADFTADGIVMRTNYRAGELGTNAELAIGKTDTDGHIHGTAPEIVFKTNSEGGKVMLNDPYVGMQLKGKDITIGDKDTFADDIAKNEGYRVIAGSGGDVDLLDSNLKVVDSDNRNVFTVSANSGLEDGNTNNYNDQIGGTSTYNIKGHGNVLFTSMTESTEGRATSALGNTFDDDSVHYLALGPNHEKAAINVVEGAETDDNSTKRVVFVDLSSKDSSAYVNPATGAIKSDADGAAPESYSMEPGSIYIRKGLVDVVPNSSDSNKAADEGSGVIRASRFVSNNMDSSGNELLVPQAVNNNLLETYNKEGSTPVVRYDRYMVNPAYTSVMKDIKLTTRGGARLSDVLPDFITKGIYVATNTYDDSMTTMKFKLVNLPTNPFALEGGPEESGTDASGNLKTEWASPFMGLVPTPQCPPGYMRVITVAPTGFMMAQAGGLYYSNGGGHGGMNRSRNIQTEPTSYFVNEDDMLQYLKTVKDITQTTAANAITEMVPDYRQLQVNSGENGRAVIEDGNGQRSVDIKGISDISVGTNYNSYSYDQGAEIGAQNTSTYVLSSIGNTSLPPMIFQQSTWLKSLSVPVYGKGSGGMIETQYGQSHDNEYARGWAVLMGFLYPHSLYGKIICGTGSSECGNEYATSVTDGGTADDVYWNIFPIRKNTLEGFVTTYCYFNRGQFEDNSDVDKYDVLNDVPTGFKKIGGTRNENSERTDYVEKLNDPRLKYNETW